MIQLIRPPKPEILDSPRFRTEIEAADRFHSDPKNAQKRFEYASIKNRDLKVFLKKMSFNKCAYCETSFNVVTDGDLECYRPKSIYWWLVYEWENLFCICAICNQKYKASSFPVKNPKPIEELQRKPIRQLNEREEPFLLDPCLDNPESHLTYQVEFISEQVITIPVSERGKVSIELLGLNRKELKELRYREYSVFNLFLRTYHLPEAEKFKDELFDQINNSIQSNNQYAGMKRWALLGYLLENNSSDLIEKFHLLKEQHDIQKTGNNIYENITQQLNHTQKPEQVVLDKFLSCHINIENFKSIDSLDFKLRSFEENQSYAHENSRAGDPIKAYRESWMLILGENGVGKSSVLQAIILTLLPDNLRKKYLKNNQILKNGETDGYVEITIDNKEKIYLRFNNKGRVESNLGIYNDYLIAYGATRLLPKGKIKSEEITSRIKVQNFFDYSVALHDGKEWLLELPDTRFDEACIYLKDLLFLNNDLSRQDGKIYTNEDNNLIELEQLSDGYKTLFALAVDLLKTFSLQRPDERYTDVGSYASGLVLIDEIGTHLHPRWKMQIVERLRNALPKVFFIVTSHEPLCLRGIRDKEVIVLKKDPEQNKVISLENIPPHEGLRIDQILTSKYFGLSSTMDADTEKAFEEYYKLLAKREDTRTNIDIARIADLQVRLKHLKQLGDNLREEIFYSVIDEVLAKNARNRDMNAKEELSQEVIDKINELLKDIDINQLNT